MNDDQTRLLDQTLALGSNPDSIQLDSRRAPAHPPRQHRSSLSAPDGQAALDKLATVAARPPPTRPGKQAGRWPEMATALAPRPLADDVEQTLIQLDADYDTITRTSRLVSRRARRVFELRRSAAPWTARRSLRPAEGVRLASAQAPAATAVARPPDRARRRNRPRHTWTDTAGTGVRHIVARALAANDRVLESGHQADHRTAAAPTTATGTTRRAGGPTPTRSPTAST